METSNSNSVRPQETTRLKRVLGVWDLIFYGIVLNQPVAAIGLFGLASKISRGLAGQLGAARLLYGMGKDNVLPRRFFARLRPGTSTPVFNLVLIAVISVFGALALNYQKVAELINFAALLAFMGVNLAAVKQFYFKSDPKERNILTDLVMPAGGFLFCLWLWLNLPGTPKIIGGIWFLAGIIYLALSTNGFRTKPVMIDFSDV